LNNILGLLIWSIPIAIPLFGLAVGAQQLAKHKAIVTCIATIEELAGVALLHSDKTGTLTSNKLTLGGNTFKTYDPFSAYKVILFAAYASCTENQDANDASVVAALGDSTSGPKLHIKKNPLASSGKLKRVTKGMTGIIIQLCSHNKTEELENKLEANIEEYATRGLHALAVTYEELDGNDHEAEGNGSELIGLLAIFDPPHEDTKQTIKDALALGTGRLGLGDLMYPAKVLKDGPAPGGKCTTLDEMITDADGFTRGLGHLCAITGNGAKDAPALSRANVGIAVEGATDAACGAADIILTEPAFIALLNDGTTRTLSVDCVLPSNTLDSWDLAEIFAYAIAYGLYLTLSIVILVVIVLESNFCQNKFGVTLLPSPVDPNNEQLHTIVCRLLWQDIPL
ncbi:hypothetical protein F5876DRAFT_83609, partial [Lentinula aff. lateritia]